MVKHFGLMQISNLKSFQKTQGSWYQLEDLQLRIQALNMFLQG